MARNKKARDGFVATQNKKAIKRQEKEAARLLKEQERRAADAGEKKRNRTIGEEFL